MPSHSCSMTTESISTLCDRARKAGITIPIIPGIKPFKKVSQLSMIPKTFKVDLPEELAQEAMKCANDEAAYRVGVGVVYQTVPGAHGSWRSQHSLLLYRSGRQY